MTKGTGRRIFIIIVALVMALVPIRFYFHLNEIYLKAAEAGMLIDYWEMRVWLLIEATSFGCLLAAIIDFRKVYWVALCLALAQVITLLYWYAELYSRGIDGTIWPGGLKGSPENLLQAGLAILFLFLVISHLIKAQKVTTVTNG